MRFTRGQVERAARRLYQQVHPEHEGIVPAEDRQHYMTLAVTVLRTVG